jgi:hypothetical protein
MKKRNLAQRASRKRRWGVRPKPLWFCPRSGSNHLLEARQAQLGAAPLLTGRDNNPQSSLQQFNQNGMSSHMPHSIIPTKFRYAFCAATLLAVLLLPITI